MGTQLQISDSLRAASEKLALVIGQNPLEPVFKKAEVVIAVRDWLRVPEVMEKIKQLQNTPSGFQTDKPEGYDEKTLSIAVTDALCAGFQLVGNEFNIIGGRMMGVLNGYSRQVRTFENDKVRMVSPEIQEGDITVNGSMVKVPMTVEYVLEDKETKVRGKHTFTRTIQLVKRYDKEGPDAWIGKATRRILKKLHVVLTGTDLGDDLGDESSAGSSAQVFSKETMPPTGTMSLKKEKPEAPSAKAAEKAEDATFTEVVSAKDAPSWTPAPAAEPAPKPTKPYAEMNAAERKVETARVAAEQKKPATPPPPDPDDVF